MARGQLERLARGERLRPAAQPCREQRPAQVVGQLTGLVGGGAVDAEADRCARVEQVAHRRDPGAEPRVRARAVRDAGPGRAHPPGLGAVQVDAVGEPDVIAQPPELVEVAQRAHAVALEAEVVLVARLGQVGVQPHAPRTGELGGLGHQLAGDRERGRRRERDARPSPPARGRGGGRSRPRTPRGSRRGPRRCGRAADRRRCARGPSHRGRDGSAGRLRARPRSRPRAGRRRRGGRCSGGPSLVPQPERASAASAARAAASTVAASRWPHTGYSATSHSNSVPCCAYPRVADW